MTGRAARPPLVMQQPALKLAIDRLVDLVAWEQPPRATHAAPPETQSVGRVAQRAMAGRGGREASLPSRRRRWDCAGSPDGDDQRGLILALHAHVGIEEGDLLLEVVHLVGALHVRVEPARSRVANAPHDACAFRVGRAAAAKRAWSLRGAARGAWRIAHHVLKE